MTDKEIIIDGIKYFKQSDINKGLDEEHYVTEFHLLATHYNLLLEDYARKYNSLKEQLKRKEQECEELKKQLDRSLSQEEEDIRQLNNDNKLDDILSAIKKANDKIEKESKYKQALDEIEEFCVIYSDNHNAYETG